jgi:hypothetical protein
MHFQISYEHLYLCLQDVLLLDVGFGQWLGEDEAVLVPAWATLTAADFSHNDISYLDESLVSSLAKLSGESMSSLLATHV